MHLGQRLMSEVKARKTFRWEVKEKVDTVSGVRWLLAKAHKLG